MKKIIKVFMTIVLFGLFLSNVSALDVRQQSLSVKDKSSTINVIDEGLGDLEITPTLEFTKVGDFITYKLVIKNFDGKKYEIASITDDNQNKNVKTNYTYDKGMNTKNKQILISLKYTEEVENTIDKLKNFIIYIKIIDEDNNAENIAINGSPKTGVDTKILVWIILVILVVISLIILFITKNKKSKKKILSILILVVLIPTTVFAVTKELKFNVYFENSKITKFYKVTFNTDGGSAIASKEIKEGELVDKPEDSIKEYYNFVKWVDEEGNDYNFDAPITKDITLKAIWTEKEYTVTYNSDGGSSVPSETKKYQETFTEPEDPTRNHYIFVKWVDEDNNDYDFATEATKNITLKAIWEKEEYTVTYNSDGGSSVPSETKKYQEVFTEPEDPTKEGYDFIKWVDEDNNDYDFATEATKNITLKAIWEVIPYTITYDLDGGIVEGTNPGSYTIETNDITLINPTKTGYTFKGWSGTDLTGDENKTVTISKGSTGNRTYTANYTINEYTVTYNSDGGSSVPSETKKYQETFTEPEDPTKEHYIFVKWVDEDNNDYDFSTKVTKDITLKAIWEKEEYTVTYNSDGGTAVPSETKKYQETFTIPSAPTKEGYDFVKWIDESGNDYDFSSPAERNITLKAVWEAVDYTITYNLDDGVVSAANPSTYTIETNDITLNNPTKTGYTFTGWTGSNGTTPQMSVTIAKGSTRDKTYTANYTINEYTVTYDSDGGSNVSPETKKYQETFTKPSDPTKTDYTFKYWMDSNGDEYDFTTPVTGDITLKAKWVGIAKLEDSWASFSSILKTGNPSNTNPYNTKNSNITSFVRATKEQYDAVKSTLTDANNKFSTSGSTADAYMWFEDSTGTTYWYSESEKIYVSGSFEKVFSNLPNLTNISGLEDFDVSGVTDMNRLFQNSKGLANLTPLTNWDTSNVTNMAFMFGQSLTASTEGMAITDLTPLANWDVSSVKSMHQMFKNCNKLTSVDPLANWNVSSIQNSPELNGAQNDNKQFEQMFNWCTELTDAKSLAGWDVSNATVFTTMFNNTTNLDTSDMPIFTVKPGSWSSNGTYTPY